MKFKIEDRVYDVEELTNLSLKMMLQLEKETQDFSHKITFADYQKMVEEIDALPEDKREDHPDKLWVTAISIWAARRLAGEQITFDTAVDFPMSKFLILPDPQDHKKSANPTKARPRKGSGRPVNPAAVAAGSVT